MENKNSKQILSQTFYLLKFTFVIVPIVAGADKFTNILTRWEQYLDPSIASLLPFSAAALMKIVGVVEIIAGIIVLKKAEIGGYIVAAWLTAIALSLLFGFNYADIAVRDLVMAISAFAMARISKIISHGSV